MYGRTATDGGRVVVTAGVAALPENTRTAVLAVVRAFDQFNTNNDPHSEHDFGAVAAGWVRLSWKIDFQDWALACTSLNPTDPTVTTRVHSIMLAKEY